MPPLDPKSDSDTPFLERLHDNAQRIERAQQALQAITRTIEQTESLLRSRASRHGASSEKAVASPDAQALMERIVGDLLGTADHQAASSSPAPTSMQQTGANRRPGRYRRLV